jgi:hypothetical protein
MKNRDTKSKSVARGGEGSGEAGILAETLTGEQGGCLLSFSVMLQILEHEEDIRQGLEASSSFESYLTGVIRWSIPIIAKGGLI